MKKLHSQRGFSLIELTIILVAIGIALAVAMQSMTVVMDDTRRAETEREMELLTNAIVGNPRITANGERSDFGYVGDVGTFPSSLNALRTNVGSRPTWSGPYLLIDHMQDTLSYLLDAWGKAYTYSGGNTITSTGGSSTITKKIANSTVDYLRNTVTGTVIDNQGNTPGTIKDDSVRIVVQVPAGASGTVTKTYTPNSSGQFTLDSIPAGARYIRAIYLPANDTLERYYTVLPHHRNAPPLSFIFAGGYFTAPVSSCVAGTFILRPNANGTTTDFSGNTGCSSDWQCVDETSADDNSSYVSTESSGWRSEFFNFPDSSIPSCAVTSVVVTCRARHPDSDGELRVAVYVSGNEYYQTTSNLTGSWTNYSTTWTTSPATGSAWTWTEINNLQAGARGRETGDSQTRITQVYVTVNYGP